MTKSQKIAGLRKKMTSRQKQLEKCSAKISNEKTKEKALKKEIEYISEEISQLEIQELSAAMTTSGITAADVQNAIIAGLIKPSANTAESKGDEEPTNNINGKSDTSEEEKEVS